MMDVETVRNLTGQISPPKLHPCIVFMKIPLSSWPNLDLLPLFTDTSGPILTVVVSPCLSLVEAICELQYHVHLSWVRVWAELPGLRSQGSHPSSLHVIARYHGSSFSHAPLLPWTRSFTNKLRPFENILICYSGIMRLRNSSIMTIL